MINDKRRNALLKPSLAAIAAAFLMVLPVACGGTGEAASDGSGGGNLTLVAYSTPREAYEELIPKFAETPAGQGVSFDQSYASSGEQSRAVEAGLPADVVAFSLAPDITRLVDAGLVADNWADDEYEGMVTNSVVVLVVRKGNPKNVQGWDDLVRDDVEVINPNPFTSGGARWNVMAAYGAQLQHGKSEEEAVEYLRKVFANIPVQDKSARESLATFTGGKGDILLAYENEAIFAQQAGEEIDYIVPAETILIENPVAVTTESQAPEKAQAFLDFLRTPEAQRVFGEKGYRPVNEEVAGDFDFPTPSNLFTIEKFGGWDAVMSEFFDREEGIMADIERELGVAIE
jgi:sulfate/thiosulfate-binding protein